MTVCLNNPVLGREITDNFTFDDTNNQIVPKPGTDTKAGALALNLGNTAGDTTNATDALTAAGFNAMANAVDSTAPLCGNEIQQAVAVAVGQSIACDAAAQEAIACAIASNPEAVACLQAVLGGSTTSGKYYVATTKLDAPQVANVFYVNNGVVTEINVPAGPTFLREVNRTVPVAYYSKGVSDPIIAQVFMTPSGATVTDFNFSSIFGFTASWGLSMRLIYDQVTNCLFMSNGQNVTAKFTLNASGLITSAVAITGLGRVYDPHSRAGKIVFRYIDESTTTPAMQVYDTATGVATLFPSVTRAGDAFVSPDGSKVVFSENFGATPQVYSTSTGAMLYELQLPSDYPASGVVYAGCAFFSEDNATVFAEWFQGTTTSNSFRSGMRAYNANTGIETPNKILGNPVTSSVYGGGKHVQPETSNNAVLLNSNDYRTGVYEGSDGVWTQVATIPGRRLYAGLYLVSA